MQGLRWIEPLHLRKVNSLPAERRTCVSVIGNTLRENVDIKSYLYRPNLEKPSNTFGCFYGISLKPKRKRPPADTTDIAL